MNNPNRHGRLVVSQRDLQEEDPIDVMERFMIMPPVRYDGGVEKTSSKVR